MFNFVFIIIIINWVHGNCKLRTKKNLGTIPGKHSVDSLQSSCIRDIAHNKESSTV
jgi:hypothetical protein